MAPANHPLELPPKPGLVSHSFSGFRLTKTSSGRMLDVRRFSSCQAFGSRRPRSSTSTRALAGARSRYRIRKKEPANPVPTIITSYLPPMIACCPCLDSRGDRWSDQRSTHPPRPCSAKGTTKRSDVMRAPEPGPDLIGGGYQKDDEI